MKILNIVSAKVWGGGEQYVYDVCYEMTKRNIENYVLLDKRNGFFQERFSHVSNILTADLYSFHGIKAVSTILNIIDTYGIEVISCHSGKMMPLCLILKNLRNIKIVLFKHNAVPVKNDIYHRYLRNHTDVIICVSDLVYRLQVSGLCDADKQKYHIVHNGILLERFEKYKEKENIRDEFVVGYAGRITENKGIGVLLRAIKSLHDVHANIVFKFVGAVEGNYIDTIKQDIKINGMEDYVSYNGLEKDMEKFYKSIDVLVLPSLVREAFGLVICEAMYCGAIVVTSNSGAQSEIIDNGKDGFIIEQITAANIYKQLDILYQSFDSLENLRKNARSKVENKFSISRTVDRIINICNII